MIPLNDLSRQDPALQAELLAAAQRVIASGWYILGPEVAAFETQWAAYCGVPHAISVANGTDALKIALRALDIGPDDDVITVANAGMYSTTAIRSCGARPVYAEIDRATLNLTPTGLAEALTPRTRAVIITHLYGRMADMPVLLDIARQAGLKVIEDCAQAHGARLHGRAAGSWGDVGCFSFYPTKNLGALGDGGALVTTQAALADRVRQLRQYGWVHKYEAHYAGGRNSRLDELQAAFLRVKLPYLDAGNAARQRIAAHYAAQLADLPLTLPAPAGGAMIYHLYVVQTPHRAQLQAALQARGIASDIHYPTPDYLQPVHADLGLRAGHLSHTEQACAQVLSLPCFPELTEAEVAEVIRGVREAMGDF